MMLFLRPELESSSYLSKSLKMIILFPLARVFPIKELKIL